MKKFTLVAMSAMMAVAANAQYNVDPSTELVVKGGVKTVDYITLSDGAIADLEKAGAKVNYVGPAAELGRNLWYWGGATGNTFNPGDDSFPRVDMEEGGYVSVVVSNQGWSGAGFAVDYNEADPNVQGIDLSHFNDDTRFHLSYMTPTGNGPASIALILLDKSEIGSIPAKVVLGTAFDDNGAIFPTIGNAINDDWQGIDISFADLKKIYPTFKPACVDHWNGNLLSFLGGGIEGQTIAFDAIYFYSNTMAGVESVEADVDFVVTANTINVNGANGIALYNLGGQLVKATDGSVLGISSLAKGVYVAKAGNKVQKIVIR